MASIESKLLLVQGCRRSGDSLRPCIDDEGPLATDHTVRVPVGAGGSRLPQAPPARPRALSRMGKLRVPPRRRAFRGRCARGRPQGTVPCRDQELAWTNRWGRRHLALDPPGLNHREYPRQPLPTGQPQGEAPEVVARSPESVPQRDGPVRDTPRVPIEPRARL